MKCFNHEIDDCWSTTCYEGGLGLSTKFRLVAPTIDLRRMSLLLSRRLSGSLTRWQRIGYWTLASGANPRTSLEPLPPRLWLPLTVACCSTITKTRRSPARSSPILPFFASRKEQRRGDTNGEFCATLDILRPFFTIYWRAYHSTRHFNALRTYSTWPFLLAFSRLSFLTNFLPPRRPTCSPRSKAGRQFLGDPGYS